MIFFRVALTMNSNDEAFGCPFLTLNGLSHSHVCLNGVVRSLKSMSSVKEAGIRVLKLNERFSLLPSNKSLIVTSKMSTH